MLLIQFGGSNAISAYAASIFEEAGKLRAFRTAFLS
jgi:hypothetical protein